MTQSQTSTEAYPAIDPSEASDQVLRALSEALAARDLEGALACFADVSYWRDSLGFGWDLQTVDRRDLPEFLESAVLPSGLISLHPDPTGVAPRWVTRAGIQAVESFFAFETATKQGRGVLRAIPGEHGALEIWNVFTSLEEIEGVVEAFGPNRPKGYADSRKFGGKNWLDRRIESQEYADHSPEVLIIGGGQAGLSIAARMGAFGADTLVIDKYERPGDNWRYRYHALTLHNSVWMNDMPYLPYPSTWPVFVPKDLLAAWLEAYVQIMSINYWGGTEFLDAQRDEEAGTWTVRVSQNGRERILHPKHIVMSTGISGAPRTPEYPGLEDFAGEWCHSSEYRDGRRYAGKRVVVLGTGNSAHDVAQDVYMAGAESVTMVQRGSTTVVSVEPGAFLGDAVYHEGNAVENSDLIANSLPYPVLLKQRQLLTAQARELDREMLEGLERIGFKLDFGADESGHEMKYMRRGGGYYMNVGCSDLLIEGKIGLLQDEEVDRIVEDGLRLKDGTVLEADLIVCAFGFLPHSDTVRRMFGDQIANNLGPVWGYDEKTGEVRNVWRRTAQEGLWFMAGNFLQCRYNSRVLAFQIKAELEGLIE